ncbi:tyrosine--tRNA ligase 1, cytoplasmic isoform X1 [Tanacetum coccineum]
MPPHPPTPKSRIIPSHSPPISSQLVYKSGWKNGETRGYLSGGDKFHSLLKQQHLTGLMSLDVKYRSVRSITEECIQEEELMNLLLNNLHPICYDGFEPSGRMHIGQGVMKVINVNKLTSAGCKVKILIADWHAQLNHKMGGNLKKIRVVGKYLIEIWKAAGMNLENVEFVLSSEVINSKAGEYWPLVIDITRENNLARIRRCCQIMGRKETDDLSAAQMLYLLMQCADVFFLKADICQLGMDQRKVNVLAREYCEAIKRKNKPIILHASWFAARTRIDVKNAYCPPGIVEGNPCLEYIKYLVFPWFNKFKVERKEENGGATEKAFANYDELVTAYEEGDLHPDDLKHALSKALNEILQPARDNFKKNENAKPLLKKVKIWDDSRRLKPLEIDQVAL